MSATEPRKRNRISTSCSSCRKRKTRCDRARPFCGRCIVDRCTVNCTYEDNVAPPENTFNDTMEINLLKHRISELETMVSYQDLVISSFSKLDLSPDDEPTTASSNNSFSKPGSRRVSSDQLSNSSIKSTPIIKQRNFNGFIFFQNNVVYINPTSFLSFNFENPVSVALFEDLLKSPDHNKLDGNDIDGTCGIEADVSNIDYNKEIGKLPEVKTVVKAINYFFDNYKPFVLFLNKELVSQLYYLLEDKGSYCTIKSSKANKTSLIAILLIILRFTYTLCPKILNGFVVNSSYVECATNLLMAYKSFKLLSFNKIQGLLLLRVYTRHCLEDDDFTGGVGVLNSILVNCARQMGISRYNYPPNIVTKEESFIWKNIWRHICYFETAISFDTGRTPLIASHEIPDDSDLMAQISKVLNPYLVKLSLSDSTSVLDLLDVLQEISTISNQRSLLQILQYPGDSIYESAQEFVLRYDLLYKEFCLYFMLYVSDESSERNKYLIGAFERILIILKFTHELTTSRVFFSIEVDQFISPRIWMYMRLVVCSLSTFIKLVLKNQFSIVESFKYFKSPDSSGVMNFIDIDFKSDRNTMVNIVKKLQEVYINGSLISQKYYSVFKACMFIRRLLTYLKVQHKEFMEPLIRGIDDFGWNAGVKFNDVYVGWHKKDDIDNLTTLDMLFASINSDMGDFVKELGDISYGDLSNI